MMPPFGPCICSYKMCFCARLWEIIASGVGAAAAEWAKRPPKPDPCPRCAQLHGTRPCKRTILMARSMKLELRR